MSSPSPAFSVTEIVSSIENCWMQTFLANGKTYLPPLAFPVSSYRGSAAYVASRKVIIYNPAVLNAQAANNGTMSVAVTLAHEIGHSVQDQTGRLGHEATRKVAELQADMLAGVAMRCLSASGALGTGDLGAAAWGRYVKGDQPDVPAFSSQAHGTPEERVEAFTQGYVNGLPPGFFNPPLLGY
jgi:predicted metalloprotease